jgi:hypothetical protein
MKYQWEIDQLRADFPRDYNDKVDLDAVDARMSNAAYAIEALQNALKKIQEEIPNPKLPLGHRIREIVDEAIGVE